MKRSRLRSYAPLAKQSEKVKDQAPDFAAVYRTVDARSEGRCEVTLESLGLVARCRKRAADHHHTVKPRRAPENHHPDRIVHLCRDHHDRAEYPFPRGRLVITPLGAGRFSFVVRYASDKFSGTLAP